MVEQSVTQASGTGPGSFVEHLSANHHGDRPAIQADGCILSYGDLLTLVDAMAARLREAGARPADRVLVMMPNCAEHIIGVLATLSVGAIAVPLDSEAGDERQADVVGQTWPRFCLACAGQPTPASLLTLRLHMDAANGTLDCPLEGAAPAAEPVSAGQEQVAFIRFTSGSTGQAKGVIIGHAQQLATARVLAEAFGIDSEHRELVLVSIALSGGWQRVTATLYGGGCVILGEKPPSVGDLTDTIVETRATGFFTPPPLVRMLLASAAEKIRPAFEDCHSIEVGSAALGANELKALMALAPAARVYYHYGLTECSRAFILDTTRHPDRLVTVGRPAPGVEACIVDEAGLAVADGHDGLILLRGPQLCSGYWQQPELNRGRFVDGWLVTGDYGSLDEAGFLTLHGRHDDLINCGGHCYFPDEVERVLGSVPGVKHYLVAGVPDSRGVLQDVPWAFVEPSGGEAWSAVEFLSRARRRLPAYMVPRHVVTVPGLPMTPSGKPDRRETVKLYTPERTDTE